MSLLLFHSLWSFQREYNKTTPACQSTDDNDVQTNKPPIQDKIDDVVVKDISKPKEQSKQEEADNQAPDNEICYERNWISDLFIIYDIG